MPTKACCSLLTNELKNTARLWNTHTGHPIATLTGHTSPVWAVAFNPDGTTLATGSYDGTARLWNTIPSPDKQIEKICHAVGRSLTKEEWSQYLPPGQPYGQICKN